MKAISLWQPWASLIAIGAKRIETRSWPTPYRGPIAIHAAKRWTQDEKLQVLRPPFWDVLRHHDGPLPLGAVVAVGQLVACDRMTRNWIDCTRETWGDNEIAFGHYEIGRYGWILDEVRALPQPVTCRGMQGLWDLDSAIVAQLSLAVA